MAHIDLSPACPPPDRVVLAPYREPPSATQGMMYICERPVTWHIRLPPVSISEPPHQHLVENYNSILPLSAPRIFHVILGWLWRMQKRPVLIGTLITDL